MDVCLLRLNTGKCKAVSYGRKPEICKNYNISDEIIGKNESIKDLGVTFDNKLKFDHHHHHHVRLLKSCQNATCTCKEIKIMDKNI